MAEYFKGLHSRPIPDISSLTSTDAYALAYNQIYAEIARILVDTANTLKTVSERPGIKSKDIGTLAGLALEFRPDEKVTDSNRLVITPDTRFYPAELKNEDFYERPFGLSAPQIKSFVDDLKRVGSPLEEIAVTSNNAPGVGIIHIVSANNFYPTESLNLSLQEGGKVYRLKSSTSISFPDIQVEAYDAINKTLAEFDQTESGRQIRLGRNRLTLLFAAQNFLVDEIVSQQARREEILGELAELEIPEQK